MCLFWFWASLSKHLFVFLFFNIMQNPIKFRWCLWLKQAILGGCCAHQTVYALTPRNYARQSIRERCLLALASFMLALIGLKKFRSFQKLNRIERGSVGLQELRRGIHASLPGSTRQDKLFFSFQSFSETFRGFQKLFSEFFRDFHHYWNVLETHFQRFSEIFRDSRNAFSEFFRDSEKTSQSS